jgi:hypothetical protein
MESFESLESWQLAHRLVLAVYRSTTVWPATDRYALISQKAFANLEGARSRVARVVWGLYKSLGERLPR